MLLQFFIIGLPNLTPLGQLYSILSCISILSTTHHGGLRNCFKLENDNTFLSQEMIRSDNGMSFFKHCE